MNINEIIAGNPWPIETTRGHLHDLPALVTQLPDALLARTTDGTPGAGPIHSPAPYNLDAARLLDTRTRYDWLDGMEAADPDAMGVEPYLRSWVLDCEASILDADPLCLPAEAPEAQSVPASCAWLLQHLEAIERLPQWPEFAWGVGRVHAACRQAAAAILESKPKRTICKECHVGTLTRDGEQHWHCDACGRPATIRLVTIPEASEIVNVGTGTLYKWAKEGRFHRTHHEGRWLYDLMELSREAARLRLANPTRQPGRPRRTEA